MSAAAPALHLPFTCFTPDFTPAFPPVQLHLEGGGGGDAGAAGQVHLLYTCFTPDLHLLFTCFAPALHLRRRPRRRRSDSAVLEATDLHLVYTWFTPGLHLHILFRDGAPIPPCLKLVYAVFTERRLHRLY
jgi:hypothetical protein